MNNTALKYNRSINSYLFILPTYILFILFVLIPLFQAFDISFQKYNILGNSKYIGFKNYLKLFDDSRLIVMYSNTIFFTFFAVIFNTGIGLLLAVMLNQRMPNLVRNLYRSIFFFPLLLAHAYIAIIWKFLYQKDTGAFNYYITNFGFDPIPWLNSAEWVLPSIIIMDVWKNTGFAMLIFLAGMPSITAFSGTSFVTTAFAPTFAFFPITTGPNICAPDPTTTLSIKVGCLLTSLCSSDLILGEIPPKVTI